MSSFSRMRATSARSGDGPRELPPQGTYKGRLVGIFDLGTQEGGQFAAKHQALLLWELFKGNRPLVDSQGTQHTASKFFTLSLNEKASLRAAVESIRGSAIPNDEEFDISELLGTGCRLQLVDYVKQSGNPGVKIKSIMALDDDEVLPRSSTRTVLFEITSTRCNIPKDVPEWVAEIVRKSPEWQGSTPASVVSAPQPASDDDNDIPF